MKNILLFSNEYPPDIGGAGVAAEQISLFLAKQNIAITLVTRKRSVREEYFSRVIYVSCMPKSWFIFYPWKMRLLDYEQFDAIILNDLSMTVSAGLVMSERDLKKSLVYLHGSEPEYMFEEPLALWVRMFGKRAYSRVLRNCKNIIAVSKYMKEKFIDKTSLVSLENKIVPIYTGIAQDELKKNTMRVDRLSKVVRLLTVSRVVKKKGFDRKYAVFKKLIKSGIKATWVIVGDGDYLQEFRKKVRGDGYSEVIILIGKVPRQQLEKYYRNADCFWLLSEFDESYGLVYLEAIHAGLPVIARNSAGPAEIIVNGTSGFLVENDDQCLDILRNKRYRDIKEEGLNQTLINHSSERTLKRLIELL